MTFSERIRKLCRRSLFISWMMAIVNAVYNCLRDGLFGRIMTAYPAEDHRFRKGKIGKFFSTREKMATLVRNVRLRIAEFFEKSVLLDIGLRRVSYLLGCSFRVYGIFLLTFGAYTVLIHYVKMFVFSDIVQTNSALYIGLIAAALAIPMIGSRTSVAELLQKGLLPHLILVDLFGVPEDRFDIPRVKGGGKYNHALLWGMLLGILTFLIPVQYILLGLLGMVLIAIIMSYPEIGVLVLIASFPVLSRIQEPFRMLDFGIALTTVAYLGKLLRGKRIIRFSLIDTLVLFFAVMIALSGWTSVGGELSWDQAMHTCMLILMYFMIVNLIRTPAWLHRAVLALIGCATLLSVVGIFQVMGEQERSILLTFKKISADPVQLSTVFKTSDMFSVYLMMLMPFCMAIFLTASRNKSRWVAAGCAFSMTVSLFFAWSQVAWGGVIFALLLFFLIYSRKTVCWLFFGGLTIPVWLAVLPQRFITRFLNAWIPSASELYQKVYTWQGMVRMIRDHWLGGIGYGTAAFREVYPRYSSSGLEWVDNAGSLSLSLLAAVGVLGLLVFAIMIFVFAQHCLEYIGNASEAFSRTFVAAGLSSVIGALVMGIGCDIWYDETALLTFFTVLALTCAYIRVGVLIRTRNQDVSGIDVSHAHVEIHFEA